MKTKLLRALFIAGLLAVFAGCMVIDDGGEDYGVNYGDSAYDPHFYDPWYEGYTPSGIMGPPPRPANLPAPPVAQPR